jgi:hypothetical protein
MILPGNRTERNALFHNPRASFRTFSRFALTERALVRESPGTGRTVREDRGGREQAPYRASHAMEGTMTDREKLLNEVFEAALQYDMTYFG